MALQSLLINEDELDKDLLEEILKPYVRLGQDSGGVRFTPLATKLSIKEKVLLFLLGRKTAALLGIKGCMEVASPKEIEEGLGISGSSLRPTLRRLFDAGLVVGQKGTYWVPAYLLGDINLIFLKKEGGEKVNE